MQRSTIPLCGLAAALCVLLAACSGGGTTKTVMPDAIPALPPIDPEMAKPAMFNQPEVLAFLNRDKPEVKQLRSLHNGDEATCMQFSPDGRFLVTADYGDMHIRVWDWREGQQVSQAKHEHRPTSMAVSPDGKGVWTGDAYQNLFWWPLSGDGELGKPESVGAKLGGNMHVAVSANGRLVATSSWDKVLTVWDAAGRKRLAQVGTVEQLRECTFSPDCKRLIVGTTTNVMLDFDLATGVGQRRMVLRVQQDAEFTAVVFSRDGKRFATGHNQPWVTIWHADGMVYERFLQCPMASISDVTYSPDGSLIAFGMGSGEFYIWDPDNDEESGSVAVLKGHEGGAKSLAFSPDGKVLATGDEHGTIILWSGGN